MASDAEPAKLLLPFLQRADELQKHEPLVAYYCRLYAMEKGLKIPQKERTKTTNSILISLMNQLEKDKKTLRLGPDDYLYVEGFASNVFSKADKQDRAGRADLSTAKTFYAASIFFEILSQFGELQPDIEQKLKYAIWKAADIRKAIKEGRKPEPGPPGGEKDLQASSSPTGTYDLGPNDSSSSGQLHPATQTQPSEKDLGRAESFSNNYPGANLSSPQPPVIINTYSAPQPPVSPTYSPPDYPPAGDYHQISPPNAQHYHSQSYSSDPRPPPQNYHSENPPPPLPQNYHFENPPPSSPQNYHSETPPPPYSYPNFQSYPSFHDASFPAAPTHQPSYYHGSDAPNMNYSSSTVRYDSGGGNGNHVTAPPAQPAAAAASSYAYDSSYQPPVEKIAEAHKAARFAVGALAFDDVPVAVEFLRKSLELLTNPKAESH